jgi:hypothetical protein
MARPPSFKYSYIALHSIPYTEGDGTPASAACGGVISQGDVVWTDHLHQRHPAQVTCFHEPVGVVCLDPRWLVSPELYRNVAR